MTEARQSEEQIAAEYAMVSQLAEDLRKRMELLNATLNEIAAAKRSLEELQKLSEGGEIWVPLGAGVFVRAKLADKSRVIVAVGANIMVEKTLEEAQRSLESKEQEVRDALGKSAADYQALLNRLRELERQIRGVGRGSEAVERGGRIPS